VGKVFITVHGTGDAVADASEPKWWQPESEFSQKLKERAGKGARVEPFIWSGDNDEMDRRRAARRLLDHLKDQHAKDDVTVVGHSHGGSVMILALRMAAAAKDSLPNIDRFVTIGAPFIKMRRKRNIWERLNFVGHLTIIYLVLLALQFAAVVGVGRIWVDPASLASYDAVDTFLEQVVNYFPVVLLAGLTIYLLSRSLGKAAYLYSSSADEFAAERLAPRWLGLYDKRDEAINGLRRVGSVSPNVISADATSGIMRFVVVVISAVILFGPQLAGALLELTLGLDAPRLNRVLFELAINPVSSMFNAPIQNFLNGPFTEWFQSGCAGLADMTGRTKDESEEVCASAPIIFRAFEAWSLLVGDLIRAVIIAVLLWIGDLVNDYGVGRIVAAMLNYLFKTELNKKAFGNTTIGERATGVSPHPSGWEKDSEALPPEPSQALSDHAADHARETLARVQELFSEDNLERSGKTIVEALTEQLSWNELIHTGYFRVPEAQDYLIDRILAPRVD